MNYDTHQNQLISVALNKHRVPEPATNLNYRIGQAIDNAEQRQVHNKNRQTKRRFPFLFGVPHGVVAALFAIIILSGIFLWPDQVPDQPVMTVDEFLADTIDPRIKAYEQANAELQRIEVFLNQYFPES